VIIKIGKEIDEPQPNHAMTQRIFLILRSNRSLELILAISCLIESAFLIINIKGSRNMDVVNIGIDLHKHQFTCYFLCKKEGKYYKYETNKHGYDLFAIDLKKIQENGFKIRVAVESTGNTRYFKNEIERLGVEVKIVNTLQFKVVNQTVNKTDKKDAKIIAEFLEKDMIPEVKLGSEKSEKLKRLINSREILVRTKVKLKNQIHGFLLSFGIDTKNGQLNSKKGRKAVIEQVKEEENKRIIEIIVVNIELLEKQVKEINDELEKMTEKDRAVEILKTIPGTGTITAVTVRSYIDNIKRFKEYNKLSGYSGLVPYVSASDDKVYYGSITKRGPIELRTAIIQMVLGMIRCKEERNNRFMIMYRNIKSRKGSGKALVAVARKFTKLIWTLLSNDTEFKKEKLIDNINEKQQHSVDQFELTEQVA
jgi:transposase